MGLCECHKGLGQMKFIGVVLYIALYIIGSRGFAAKFHNVITDVYSSLAIESPFVRVNGLINFSRTSWQIIMPFIVGKQVHGALFTGFVYMVIKASHMLIRLSVYCMKSFVVYAISLV